MAFGRVLSAHDALQWSLIASQFEVYKNGCTFQVQNSYRPRVPFQTKGQQVCSTVKTRAILQYIYGDHINMIHMCQAR